MLIACTDVFYLKFFIYSPSPPSIPKPPILQPAPAIFGKGCREHL